VTAIVGGILLAFWIQAWWDHRQEVEDEVVVLAALLDEFRAKTSQLEMRRAFHTSLLESCRKLIRASISDDGSLTPEEVDRLLADLWWYNPQGEWESAILGALFDGGSLTVISDPELRINLAQWPSSFRLLEQQVSRDEEYFKTVLMPFMTKNAYLPQVYLYLPSQPGEPSVGVRSPGWDVPERVDNSAILENPEFANILTEKVDRHLAILDIGFNGLDEELAHTIALLEEAIGDLE
jgi:hypothetical protein